MPSNKTLIHPIGPFPDQNDCEVEGVSWLGTLDKLLWHKLDIAGGIPISLSTVGMGAVPESWPTAPHVCRGTLGYEEICFERQWVEAVDGWQRFSFPDTSPLRTFSAPEQLKQVWTMMMSLYWKKKH